MPNAVAVFDADAPPALAFVRSLGRAGIPVRVYACRRLNASRLSRFASSSAMCPSPTDYRAFLAFLHREIDEGRIHTIAPTSDLMAFYLAEVRDRLPEAAVRMLPTSSAIFDVLFKDRFTAAGEKLRTPRTLTPRSRPEAMDTVSQLRFPVVVKPRSHIATVLERGAVARDVGEFEKAFRRLRATAGMAPVLEKFPDLVWPVVQELLPTAARELYSISGVLADDGTALAVAGSQKNHHWPSSLGVGLRFLPWFDRDIMERAVDYVRATLGRGLFELEITPDPDGDGHVALDLNPRAHGFIQFDISRGNDLPKLWYDGMSGCATAQPWDQTQDLTWIHSVPFHLRYGVHLLGGENRMRTLREYVGALRTPHVDITHDGRDPAPTALYLARMFRHPGGLVRPFVKELTRRSRRKVDA